MNAVRYKQLLRLLAFLSATSLWGASVFFSHDGFAIQIPEYGWMGWVFALIVTALQIIWNSEGFEHNLTILAGGLIAYLYGIGTNVIGIFLAQGKTMDIVSDNPFALIFPLILGFIIEVLPEPLLVWALVGRGGNDLLSNLFSGVRTEEYSQPHTYVRNTRREPAETLNWPDEDDPMEDVDVYAGRHEGGGHRRGG
jgi:hypothetical protein